MHTIIKPYRGGHLLFYGQYIYVPNVKKSNFHYTHTHSYTPVTVRGREFFRGFFLQARDAETNEWIGSWQDSQNTKTIPECASITHSDPRDKEGANLIWNAPQHKSGRVYFTYVFAWLTVSYLC